MGARGVYATATALIVALACPISSHAGELYFGGTAGVSLTSDADVAGTGINTSIDFDPGPIAVIAAGYKFDNGFRGELELAGRWNDVESVGSTSSSGDTAAYSGMLNALYDIKIEGPITPYVGAGLGIARIDDNSVSPIGGSSVSDDDTALAYQAILGISYDLSESMALTADYRYFASDDLSLTTASSVAVEQEYSSHAILVGLRLELGGGGDAMPAPSSEVITPPVTDSTQIAATSQPDAETPVEQDNAAASASSEMAQIATASAATTPEFPRAYRILFDWDKETLGLAAQEIVSAVAMNAQEGEIIRIKAIGHADRSGTADYNATLSRKRAETVKRMLIEMGLPEDQIMIDWRGENEPVVATDDGVRERQNRRVEIVFPTN